MRREGFELSVSPPRVVYREEGGQKQEPMEEVICEVEDEQAGSIIEVSSPGNFRDQHVLANLSGRVNL